MSFVTGYALKIKRAVDVLGCLNESGSFRGISYSLRWVDGYSSSVKYQSRQTITGPTCWASQQSNPEIPQNWNIISFIEEDNCCWSWGAFGAGLTVGEILPLVLISLLNSNRESQSVKQDDLQRGMTLTFYMFGLFFSFFLNLPIPNVEEATSAQVKTCVILSANWIDIAMTTYESWSRRAGGSGTGILAVSGRPGSRWITSSCHRATV